MDPFSALSIATSVVQFAEFTTKIVVKWHQIYKNGSFVDVNTIKKEVEELRSWVAGYKSSTGTRDEALISQYRDFDHITTGCIEVANKTISMLNRFTLQKQERSFVKIFLLQAKMLWKKGEVEELIHQLEGYQRRISFHIQFLQYARGSLQWAHVGDCLDNIQKIVEIQAYTRGQNGSQNHSQGMKGSDSVPTIQTRREEVVSVLLHFEDGSARAVHFGKQQESSVHSAHTPNIERAITVQTQSESFSKATIYDPIFHQTCQKVLDLLHLRMINTRFKTANLALEGTLDWSFKPPIKEQASWSDFGKWLREGNGLYWITGKPGSGKTTLMKHMYLNPKTEEGLDEWKDSQTLKVPYLIPSAFPDVYQVILSEGNLESPLTLDELQIAFESVIQTSINVKFCLFLDGLDEYSGDHRKLVKFLEHCSRHSHVKIVASSRPWVLFDDAFKNKPHLRMEDLTYQDIEQYISEHLHSSVRLQELSDSIPQPQSSLVSGICQKAQGVFLWVVLVVRSIIRAAQEGKSQFKLLERIEQFPSDLEDTYQHILNGMDLKNQKNIARTMLIILNLRKCDIGCHMNVLQLALVEKLGTSTDHISNDCAGVSLAYCSLLSEGLVRQIKHQTLGLFESSQYKEYPVPHNQKVEFFHRTALDFFLEDPIQMQLKSSAGFDFDPNLSLILSYLYEIRFIKATARAAGNNNQRFKRI
ncbi:hypothetical protein BS50DRAFT_652386 [Corynespora cassiicola Philippines]|uniref:Uncharacterized protein n=1 Tax=Corynespora cassiicola Philippines TaxID=1448308 RepID=A0A2T2N7U0_CORCC|nr:hypothetical protein BS50DRAFT_652386 [Corynespora cassiicola Philippines]